MNNKERIRRKRIRPREAMEGELWIIFGVEY
jgi:hypothetical protein